MGLESATSVKKSSGVMISCTSLSGLEVKSEGRSCVRIVSAYVVKYFTENVLSADGLEHPWILFAQKEKPVHEAYSWSQPTPASSQVTAPSTDAVNKPPYIPCLSTWPPDQP